MKRTQRQTITPDTLRPARSRRGNVLVLVAGILVLLVIVASSYLARANAERTTAIAQRSANLRDDRAGAIADELARELSEALFVRPVNTAVPFIPADLILGTVARPSANLARRPPAPDAVRYGSERAVDDDDLTNVFHHGAPHHVYPWTNWPDALQRPDDLRGEPGFNDTRWLRDTEPNRMHQLGDYGPDGIPFTADDVEFFTHWTHLSNIMRMGNGWMLIADMSDIRLAGHPNGATVVTDMQIPFEQWQPHLLPANYEPFVGRSFISAADLNPGVLTDRMFMDRWFRWFGLDPNPAFSGLAGYASLYNLPGQAPSNFYHLNQLDGNNTPLNIGERPQDEFNPNSLRWLVSRVLADADGDGRTDSFWFLAPTMIEGGLRQAVAISIVDNSGLLNFNTGTQFVRGNPNTTGLSTGTVGHTPVDLALYEGAAPDPVFNVGFLNSFENSELAFPSHPVAVGPDDSDGPYGELRAEWDTTMWDGATHTFLGQIGGNMNRVQLRNPFQRLDYWRRGAGRPFDPAYDTFNVSGGSLAGVVRYAYNPFGLADELELRAHHGSNTPWTMSRFERSLIVPNTNAPNLLRATLDREETNEYLDQLKLRPMPSNYNFDELLHDRRRMMTLFSGARNDLVAPWLRWEMRIAQEDDPSGTNPAPWRWPTLIDVDAEARFLAQSRLKLDLREDPRFNFDQGTGLRILEGVYNFAERLPWALLKAFSTGVPRPSDTESFGYYFKTSGDGSTPLNDLNRTRRLSAAYAANILAWRSRDAGYAGIDLTNPTEVIPVPLVGGQSPTMGELGTYDFTTRYLGMERQPFLVECFIGHLYRSQFTVPGGWSNAGARVVFEDHEYDPIIVVQIANPYDRPIDLAEIGAVLGVFGKFANLSGVIRPGSAKTFYHVGGPPSAEWIEALDLNDHPEFEPPTALTFTNGTPTRADFDSGNEEIAIELYRAVPQNGTPVAVLIDRIDIHADDNLMVPSTIREDYAFGEEVRDLATSAPPPFSAPPIGPPGAWDTGIILDEHNTHWMQYARASRMWRNPPVDEVKTPPTLAFGRTDDDPDRRSPRYIFSARRITSGTAQFNNVSDPDLWLLAGDEPDDPMKKVTTFDRRYKYVRENQLTPEVTGIDDFALQMLQKNGDFEQVGEVLNVFLFGHQLRFGAGVLNSAGNDRGTSITFSEFMVVPTLVGGRPASGPNIPNYRVNRLRLFPQEFDDGQGTTNGREADIPGLSVARDPHPLVNVVNHSIPIVPIGLRVLDLFVCDDFGVSPIDLNNDGVIDLAEQEASRFRNAMGFSGSLTPGLVNVNTAPREVMRSLPHWYGMVHRTGVDPIGNTVPVADQVQRSRLPEAVERYRDKKGDFFGMNQAPNYLWRGISGNPNSYVPDMRSEPGMVSPAEVNLLLRGGSAGDSRIDQSWLVDFARLNPFRDSGGALLLHTDLSTDTQHRFDTVSGAFLGFDNVANDVEEANLLYGGASNLLTSRSDVFTVYFQVRTFRRNPVTGEWNALDPDNIVDDSRYVMVVDRSEVNAPGDKPRILFLEKFAK